MGRARRAPRRSLPDGFGISERVRAWNAEKGYPAEHLDVHLAVFRTKAAAGGYVYADWDAAFMEAIREDWAGARAAGSAGVLPLRGSAPGRLGPPRRAQEASTVAIGASIGLEARPGESLEAFADRVGLELERRRTNGGGR